MNPNDNTRSQIRATMSQLSQARAERISDWIQYYRTAKRYGSDEQHAARIADVLTFGQVQPVNLTLPELSDMPATGGVQ